MLARTRNDEQQVHVSWRQWSGVVLLAAVLSLAAASPGVTAQHSLPAGVSHEIKVSGFPGFVEVGLGSVWVGAHRGGTIYRIDPRTNKVSATISGAAPLCGTFRFGFGAIWAMSCLEFTGETTYRIDARSNRIVRTYSGTTPATGAGSIWLASWQRRMVVRVDPRSGRVLARIRKLGFDENQRFIAHGARFGSVWIYTDAAVARISTKTNKVTAVIALPGAEPSGAGLDGGDMEFSAGAAWVANPAGLFRIDPKTNIAHLFRVGVKPFREYWLMSFAPGARSLWMRTNDRTVARISATSGKVIARYPAAGGGGGVAFGFRSIWVANFTDNSVWRIPIAG